MARDACVLGASRNALVYALEALSEFLAGLEIGKSGHAMIIDAQGRLVAFPDPSKVVEAVNGEFRPTHGWFGSRV